MYEKTHLLTKYGHGMCTSDISEYGFTFKNTYFQQCIIYERILGRCPAYKYRIHFLYRL